MSKPYLLPTALNTLRSLMKNTKERLTILAIVFCWKVEHQQRLGGKQYLHPVANFMEMEEVDHTKRKA